MWLLLEAFLLFCFPFCFSKLPSSNREWLVTSLSRELLELLVGSQLLTISKWKVSLESLQSLRGCSWEFAGKTNGSPVSLSVFVRLTDCHSHNYLLVCL